ncbi:unnamed protein product [Echinostoma caproni]|uniref:EF-hand domain-containing protein n=1 Tax=Echinostoma caproni TaxID=27848 RepID=A0A183AAW9_9TREM|nr:unnamed protein product [Echinostoma caproni]
MSSVKPADENASFKKLEKELIALFHGDFLALLSALREHDHFKQGTLSPANFKTVLQTQFGFGYSETGFRSVLDRLPLDPEGNIQYAEFMRQFDSTLRIEPEITRGELRALWPTLFTGVKQMLTLHEIFRHFLYKKSEAAYPNAKLVPPRLGDSDLRPCSNRLNGVTCLLKDSLRSKIELYYLRLLDELTTMDNERTGFVPAVQFESILSELCPSLTKDEIQELIDKYDLRKDNHVCYLAMLKPFARKWEQAEAHATWLRAREKRTAPDYHVQGTLNLADWVPKLGLKKRVISRFALACSVLFRMILTPLI